MPFEFWLYYIKSWFESRRSLAEARRALEAAFTSGKIARAVNTFEGTPGTNNLDVEFEVYDSADTLLSCEELFPGIHVTALRVAMDKLRWKKNFLYTSKILHPLPMTHASRDELTFIG